MNSLATKLTLAFLFVGLSGALLVALLVGWQTERQFDRFILELYREELTDLNHQLQEYYQRTGSWEGVNSVAIRAGRGGGPGHSHWWQPVTLVDAEGTVISGGTAHQVGEQVARRFLRDGIPVQVEGQTVGWILVDSLAERVRPSPTSPEGAFLGNVWRATALSAMGAIVLALLLGIVLARTISRPVQDLTVATQAVAQGELGRQVPVHTRDELGELATSFNQMSRDLAHATHLRRQMTANIAHDLRTPLSALLGYTEALSEGKFEGTPEIHRILHQETQHLQRLIDDLRTLSLADAGELPLYPEPTPVEGLLERVVLAHGAQAAAQEIELSLQTRGPLPPLNVDPERMVQVLGNLLRNALRHTPAGGHVRLRAEAGGSQVRLQVEDDGAGIPPEDLPHIWERLYRGDKARAQDGSSGLGLAIARSLVQAQGGTVSVTSQSGQGSTFTVTLPVNQNSSESSPLGSDIG